MTWTTGGPDEGRVNNIAKMGRVVESPLTKIVQKSKHNKNSSLVDSTYDCKIRQNATLSGQERQGDVQL